MLTILLSITYVWVSLINNSGSRGNLRFIDYYLKYRQNQYNSKVKQNNSKIPNSLTRGRKFPIYSIFYIEKYSCDMLSYDSTTVSSAWELASVSMRDSQGEGVNTSLSRTVYCTPESYVILYWWTDVPFLYVRG